MSLVADAIANIHKEFTLSHRSKDNIELSGNCSKHRRLRRALNQVSKSKLFMPFSHS